jgi:hypothetical protein
VDCRLIVDKGRGLNEKWLEYSIFEIIFLIGNGHGPGPWLGGPRIGHRRWLAEARPNGRSGPQRLAMRVVTGRA